MDIRLLSLQIVTFSLAAWLGVYLIGRDTGKVSLRYAGLGLAAYASALGAEALSPFALDNQALAVFGQVMIYMPAVFWNGAVLAMLPESYPGKVSANRIWLFGVLPISLAVILWAAVNGWSSMVSALAAGIPLIVGLRLFYQATHTSGERYPLGLFLLGGVFFELSIILFLPLVWVPRWIMMIGIGVDLGALGVGIAILDAFQEGHTLRQDMLHSLRATLIVALLFGGQVALAISLGIGFNFLTVLLLLATLTTAIGFQTLNRIFQAKAGQFSTHATNSQAIDPKASSSRIDPSIDFEQMSEAEFNRLTRRAISYLSDLPRLANSPLTRLPVIAERIQTRGAPVDTLERANELKLLLTESINRLKPHGNDEFGISDEWRFYNALYYPYVAGLKPTRRRQPLQGLPPAQAQALSWFQAEVPERTLHNWQNAAAKLIAKNLQEQSTQN